MPVRRRLLACLSALLIPLLFGAVAQAAPPPGQDAAAVEILGNFPAGPNTYGNIGVSWGDGGTSNLTGITHITVYLPPSLTTDGALMYAQPANYDFTEAVSPDGHELDATFIGTMTPGSSDFMKVELTSGAAAPTGTAVAVVAHPGDVNPANNRVAVPVSPPDSGDHPLPAAPKPAFGWLSTSTGPSSGGTTVTVHGSNLTAGIVRFGSALANTTTPAQPASAFDCTATECTVTTPPAAGVGDVTVTTPGGTTAIVPRDRFRFAGPPPPPPAAPTVQHLSVSSGPNAGGTYVVVIGTNLDQGSISFGANPGLDTSCGPTLCTSTAPPGSGQVNLTVTTAGGSSSSPFTYTG